MKETTKIKNLDALRNLQLGQSIEIYLNNPKLGILFHREGVLLEKTQDSKYTFVFQVPGESTLRKHTVEESEIIFYKEEYLSIPINHGETISRESKQYGLARKMLNNADLWYDKLSGYNFRDENKSHDGLITNTTIEDIFGEK